MPKINHTPKNRRQLIPIIATILTNFLEQENKGHVHDRHPTHTDSSQNGPEVTKELLSLSLAKLVETDAARPRVSRRNEVRNVITGSTDDLYASDQQKDMSSGVSRQSSVGKTGSSDVFDVETTSCRSYSEAVGTGAETARTRYPSEAPSQSSRDKIRVSKSFADKNRAASPAGSLTHSRPEVQILEKIDVMHNSIGERITHEPHSTSIQETHQDLDMFVDLIKECHSPISKLYFGSDTTIEPSSDNKDILLFAEQYYPAEASGTLYSQLLTNFDGTFSYTTMASTHSRQTSQTLSEILGDDQFLWKMWKRRSSLASPDVDDATLLHDMFVNDPDMKLFKLMEEDDLQSDTMMFDSFDFSRQSTNSSRSSSGDSCSSATCNGIGSSRRPSLQVQTSPAPRSPRNSTREAEERQGKAGVAERPSGSNKMSEESLIAQQMISSRNISIKSRKSPVGYSRAW